MAGLAKGPEAVGTITERPVSLIAENYGFDPRFRMSDVQSSLGRRWFLYQHHMNLNRVARLADWMSKGVPSGKEGPGEVHQRLLGALSARGSFGEMQKE